MQHVEAELGIRSCTTIKQVVLQVAMQDIVMTVRLQMQLGVVHGCMTHVQLCKLCNCATVHMVQMQLCHECATTQVAKSRLCDCKCNWVWSMATRHMCNCANSASFATLQGPSHLPSFCSAQCVSDREQKLCCAFGSRTQNRGGSLLCTCVLFTTISAGPTTPLCVVSVVSIASYMPRLATKDGTYCAIAHAASV